MNTLLIEPLKYFDDARQRHNGSVTERFESLVNQSGIDVEANRDTAAKYRAKLGEIDVISAKIRKYEIIFWLLITAAAAFVIASIALAPDSSTDIGIKTTVVILAVISVITVIMVNVKILRPRIKSAENVKANLISQSEEILAVANEQMAPLNALFDPADTRRLIEKTMPELDFYECYTPEHERLLTEEYDYIDLTDDDTSVTDTLSGRLLGNPFLYERYIEHTLRNETYSGSITIHWTTTSRDSKGNSRTEHHTQVLTATVTKPKPFYTVSTHLGYGCEAAPNLSFSRNESDTDELSEGALARRIKRGAKKLQRRAEKSASRGDNFQEMANTEFEVLFGAQNRNHEVQFRLMYTPLAQTNTVDLLRSKIGYGDDFNFIKQGKYNIIKSVHAQDFKMQTDVSLFKSYDVDIARNAFISYNNEYFKSVFFDLAPLLAIPAYHEHRELGEDNEDKKDFASNFTQYEHEVLANAVGARKFAHPDTATDTILKTKFIKKDGIKDRVLVSAYSYRTVPRTEVITMYGRDGKFHNVPVHWTEYIPLLATREMTLSKAEAPCGDAYVHGISATICN